MLVIDNYHIIMDNIDADYEIIDDGGIKDLDTKHNNKSQKIDTGKCTNTDNSTDKDIKSQKIDTGKCTDNSTDKDKDNNNDNIKNNKFNPTEILENTLIGKLAQNISSKLDPDEFGDTNNPDTYVNNLLANKDGGLQKILASVIKEVDKSLSSGTVNRDDLASDAKNIMKQLGGGFGGLGGLSNLFKNFK